MYVTFYRDTYWKQRVTFADLYNNFGKIEIKPEQNQDGVRHKYTANGNLTKENYNYYMEHYPIHNWLTSLKAFLDSAPIPLEDDMSKHYETFQIPKRSGGFRTIEAPNADLKAFQDNIRKMLVEQTCWIPHDAAYAYVKQREIKKAVVQHKNSNWFLKLDLHGFFPSCNLDTIYKHMVQVFPFTLMDTITQTNYEIIQIPKQTNGEMPGNYVTKNIGNETLKRAIKYALVNDHLPQGTPLSPALTNILMVPFDAELTKILPKEMVYTRYADDLLISSPYEFNWQETQQKIIDLLKKMDYPFELNKEKTRYGSIAGRNWNLGLMLNKDHAVTIGNQKKKRLKAALFNFFADLTNGKPWDRIDVQTLQGQLAFARHIEPEYFDSVIKTYEEKFNINFAAKCREIINS